MPNHPISLYVRFWKLLSKKSAQNSRAQEEVTTKPNDMILSFSGHQTIISKVFLSQ